MIVGAASGSAGGLLAGFIAVFIVVGSGEDQSKAELESLRSEVASLATDMNATRSDLDSLSGDVKASNSQIVSLISSTKDAAEERRESYGTLTRLQERFESLQEKTDILHRDLGEAESAIGELAGFLSSEADRLDKVQEKHAKSSANIKEGLERLLDSATEFMESRDETIAELRKKQREIIRDYDELEVSVVQTIAKQRDIKKRVEKLEQ